MPVKESVKESMKIVKIQGSDRRLYSLIGPLVMDPEVIGMNDGYPFKNTSDHVWYIAIKGKNKVAGFISVVNNKLCNDFTWQDYELLEDLIQNVLSDMKDGIVSFIAEQGDIPLLEKLGFAEEKRYVKYVKMIKAIV
ncbi:MAG: hypothetical protein LBR26_09310 [Prevotella sp.]|jgi:hypothetical protein|nr:hypothetical protein [Prevotella sp.]